MSVVPNACWKPGNGIYRYTNASRANTSDTHTHQSNGNTDMDTDTYTKYIDDTRAHSSHSYK